MSHVLLTEVIYRYPYFAADVLSCNVMIMEALVEGGWSKEESKSNDNEDLEDNENSLVQSILNKKSVSVTSNTKAMGIYVDSLDRLASQAINPMACREPRVNFNLTHFLLMISPKSLHFLIGAWKIFSQMIPSSMQSLIWANLIVCIWNCGLYFSKCSCTNLNYVCIRRTLRLRKRSNLWTRLIRTWVWTVTQKSSQKILRKKMKGKSHQ